MRCNSPAGIWVSESGGEKIELPHSYDIRRLANESKELIIVLSEEEITEIRTAIFKALEGGQL